MEIIDNFLDKKVFSELQEFMMESKLFPWYCQQNVANANEGKNETYSYYFTHHFYLNEGFTDEPKSYLYNLIQPILDIIQPEKLIRIKANLYPSAISNYADDFHTDYSYKHKGALFAINTNNGGTLFKDGTKIDSVANRIFFFDPTVEHASVRCTDQKFRVNINFNYL